MAAAQYFFNQAAEIVLQALSNYANFAGISWKIGLISDHDTDYTFTATDTLWSSIATVSKLEDATNLSGGYTGPDSDAAWAASLTRSTDTISMDFTVLPNWATVNHDETPANITAAVVIAVCQLDAVGDKLWLFSYHKPAAAVAVNGSNIDLSWASRIPWDLELPNA